MKKLLAVFVLFFVGFLCLLPTSALESGLEIHTMEELIEWYESGEESCYFANDIVFDQYYEFNQTDNRKVMDTKEFSLIINNGFIFNNSKLLITGSGIVNPVLKLDSQGKWSRVRLYFLDLVATDGNALMIGEKQDVEFYTSWANDFPVKIKAKKYALMNYYINRPISFNLAKLTSETKDAIWVKEEADVYLYYCDINQQTNLNNVQIRNSFVGGVISNDDFEIYYDIEFNEVLVKNMNDFDLSMAPIVEVEYESCHVNWDLTEFDKSKDSNVVTGKIDIIPMFTPYLVGDKVAFNVIKKEASPIIDFDIHLLQPWFEDTYRPWFSVTYPLRFDRVYLEVYRTEELLFREYDISDDVESYYSRKDFYFLARDFSNIKIDEIYYCRLRVEGGFYEGVSNFIRIHNWDISYVNPFPEIDQLPILPPENPTLPPTDSIPNEPIVKPEENLPAKPTIKPDTSDPDDNKGGSGGHRGDQNREDVPEEDTTIEMTPEQIEGLDKSKEDIVIIVKNQQFTVSSEQVGQWKELDENIEVGIDENNQPYYQTKDEKVEIDTKVTIDDNVVANDSSNQKDGSSMGLYISTGIVVIAGIGWQYKRKYHGK